MMIILRKICASIGFGHSGQIEDGEVIFRLRVKIKHDN